MGALPVTTDCYIDRWALLGRLQQTLAHSHAPECTCELAACFEPEARFLHASIEALQAEPEQQ